MSRSCQQTMLTILIKAYCNNVVVDIKSIYLSKYYLFQNKIYYLNKIYFCFRIIKLFKHAIKKEAVAQMFSCEFSEIAKNTFLAGSSLIYNTSATRATQMQYEWDTSNTSATRVRHEQHKCNTSATRVLHKQHECDTSEKFWFW